MRKVEYKTYKKINGKNELITKIGHFHHWGTEYLQESNDYNQGGWTWLQSTVAIIEAENGQIVTVSPESVKFVESI